LHINSYATVYKYAFTLFVIFYSNIKPAKSSTGIPSLSYIKPTINNLESSYSYLTV
jgi:hypothetical protein